MDLSYQEIVDLAIDLAIDLDNFSLGKIQRVNHDVLEKLRQWFVDTASILCSDKCIYDAGLSPLGFVALNSLFADFFQLPKCAWNKELGERIKDKVNIFVFSDMDGAAKLRDFCTTVSKKFQVLRRCSSYRCRLAA